MMRQLLTGREPVRRPLLGICAALFMGVLGAAPGFGAVSTKAVDSTLEKAREYLYSKTNAQGIWEEVDKPEDNGDEGRAQATGRQWGGLTSIATYALLAAGESPQEPRLAKAIAFLKTADIRGIYALGLRCQVWLKLRDDKSIRPFIARDRDLLLRAIYQDTRKTNESSFGFYSYYVDKGPKPLGWYDHSVSQYGVLGMWALEQSGAEVPITYWKAVDAAWRRAQLVDGGWSYRLRGEGPSPDLERTSPSMTAAGIATLFITQDYMLAESAGCRGNVVNSNIERGLAWMDKHVRDELAGGNYYTLYGIERIGVASGRKYFSTINWYELGSESIVQKQADNGSWNDSIPDTCFAMLFLARGRAPVVLNKLQYELVDTRGGSAEANWNQRLRDAANFSRWLGRQIERDLNWQAVNLKVSADELHDSPILYLTGNQELKLSTSEVDKLRQYVEQGGIILGNADCGSKPFSLSFQKLGKLLFPDASYAFRELEPTHPINGELYHAAKGRTRIKVLGLSNGVRELMLLVPEGDISRSWQAQAEKTHQEAYEAGANIVLYAIDKGSLRYKGDSYVITPDPQIKPARRVSLVRLEVGDNWNPEPGGWRRMAALLQNEFKIGLDVKTAKPDAAGLSSAKIAHLTGTTTFQLTSEQRSALKDFVSKGGTLIVDAAGGAAPFAEAAEAELRALFGKPAEEALSQPLAADDPLYHLPNAPVQIQYRSFTKASLGNTRAPRLKAIPLDGRYAVFYSREDLTIGLVGQAVDGILGYDPAAATQIMRNLILYASAEKNPHPATKPSTTAQSPQ